MDAPCPGGWLASLPALLLCQIFGELDGLSKLQLVRCSKAIRAAVCPFIKHVTVHITRSERESKACALMRRLPPGCQLSSLRIVQKGRQKGGAEEEASWEASLAAFLAGGAAGRLLPSKLAWDAVDSLHIQGFRLGLVALPYLGLAVPGLLRLTLQDSSVEAEAFTGLLSCRSLEGLTLVNVCFKLRQARQGADSAGADAPAPAPAALPAPPPQQPQQGATAGRNGGRGRGRGRGGGGAGGGGEGHQAGGQLPAGANTGAGAAGGAGGAGAEGGGAGTPSPYLAHRAGLRALETLSGLTSFTSLSLSGMKVPSLTFVSSLTSLTALHLKDCDFSTPTYPAPSGPPWSQLLAQLPPLPSLLLLHLAHPPGHPRSAHPLTGPHLHSLLAAAPHLTSLDLGPHQDLAHCCLGVLAAHPHLASLRVRDLRPDPALLQRLTQVADAAQRNREAAAGGAAQAASLNQGQASGTATAPGGEGLQAVAEGALGAQGQGGVAAPGGPTSVGEGSSAAAAAPMDLAASSTAPPAPASLAGRSATGADLVPPGEPAPCPPAAPPAQGQREGAVREEGKAVGMEVGQAAGEEEGGAAAGAPAQGAPPVVGGQVAGAKRGAGGQPGPEEQPEAKRLAASSGEQQGQADEGIAPPASAPLAPRTSPQGPPNSPPASPLHPTSPPASPGSDMHNGPDPDPCGPCSSPQPPRRAPPHPWLIPAAPLGPLHHTMQQDPRQALLDVLREYHASQLEQEHHHLPASPAYPWTVSTTSYSPSVCASLPACTPHSAPWHLSSSRATGARWRLRWLTFAVMSH
ncbi:hypothetical protein V8C86DRAFT_878695 [Haematococcus lacustris]